MTRAALLVLGLAAAACSRAEPSASSSSGPVPSVAATGAPSASAAAREASAPAAPVASSGAWSGAYTAAVGSLTVPEWTGVKFRGEDASVGLGSGTMHVTLSPDGRATGTLDGALGATKIDGAARDGAFSATLVPDDPAAGFSGTAVGQVTGDRLAGTMRLSLATGNVIREATFSLARAN